MKKKNRPPRHGKRNKFDTHLNTSPEFTLANEAPSEEYDEVPGGCVCESPGSHDDGEPMYR